jgi:hypothetical protein
VAAELGNSLPFYFAGTFPNYRHGFAHQSLLVLQKHRESIRAAGTSIFSSFLSAAPSVVWASFAGETIFTQGNAHEMRDGFAPLAEKIENIETITPISSLSEDYSIDPILDFDTQAKADAGSLSVVTFGLIGFVGGWAANKFLDEVYERKLRPLIFDSLPSLENASKNSKKKELQVGIWYEAESVFVLISVLGDSYLSLETSRSKVTEVHISARSWIESNGVKAPIHYYEIRDGSVNIDPQLFHSIQEARTCRNKNALTIDTTRPSLRTGD